MPVQQHSEPFSAQDLAFEVERLAALPAEDVLEEPRLCGTWSLIKSQPYQGPWTKARRAFG